MLTGVRRQRGSLGNTGQQLFTINHVRDYRNSPKHVYMEVSHILFREVYFQGSNFNFSLSAKAKATAVSMALHVAIQKFILPLFLVHYFVIKLTVMTVTTVDFITIFY